MSKIRSIETLPLDGGVLCFNFINTVYAWKGVNLHEYISSYEEVILWCKKVGILDTQQRSKLLEQSVLHPGKALKALVQMKEARALLYNLFSAIAAGMQHNISPQTLAGFNTALSNSFAHLALAVNGKEILPQWSNPQSDLLEPLWVVMKSAFDIIMLKDWSRLKECPRCGWIFIDKTKNNTRKWCNPAFCGSTEKSKKYYQKIKRT